MNITIFALAFITSLPLMAQDTPKTPIFHCKTESDKTIEIYKELDVVTYSFGKTNEFPELQLKKTIGEIEISIGQIYGNELSNSATFTNGAYTYTVVTTINRNAETQEPRHGVIVKKKSNYLAYIACIPDTVQGSLLDLE
ncbi:hypothetical protein [Stutzerimonas nosocomialis]|uniref:hypothetical protein n=1 Tax=Stutzerimonas nosocomialis TaxID=1056496 RepID=UPI0011083DA9|nr:hypothetical protein [Stutzerimonas nosocomialis]